MQGLPVVQNLVNPAQAGASWRFAGDIVTLTPRGDIPARLVRAFFYP
jgi:hypothetical protein